ncbi:hypothetical protein V9T40_008261 [Parthenolecanium corni]|uniref:Uncharacterized protein n=1 Tax=Parthenolecanium corni TaxID=536013 RepID=A0AAN9TQ93_9HEMI
MVPLGGRDVGPVDRESVPIGGVSFSARERRAVCKNRARKMRNVESDESPRPSLGVLRSTWERIEKARQIE